MSLHIPGYPGMSYMSLLGLVHVACMALFSVVDYVIIICHFTDYPPSNLQWAIPPPVKIIAGKQVSESSLNKTTALIVFFRDEFLYLIVCPVQLSEVSVFSESFTVGDLEIVVNGE